LPSLERGGRVAGERADADDGSRGDERKQSAEGDHELTADKVGVDDQATVCPFIRSIQGKPRESSLPNCLDFVVIAL
jgi:hypothetical protein